MEWRPLLTAAVPLVLAHAVLAVLYDLEKAPHLTFLWLAFAFGSYLWAGRRCESRAGAAGILGVAAVLRLLLLPLPPTLSDDILRYGWDGKLVLAGFNPYLLEPDAEELRDLRDERWQRMPHREIPTVYPPLALTVFSVANLVPLPLLGIKVLLTLAELGGCFLLIRLAVRLGLPAGRAVWYCWNPLVALETAGMGHVDALVAAAAIATVWLLGRPSDGSGRASRATAAAGAATAAAAVLAKLIPAVALPMWARQSGRPIAFLAAAGVLVGLFLLPVFVSTGGVPPGLVKFGVSWEFNGPLFEPLAYVLSELPVVETVKGGLDAVKNRTGDHDFWNRFYPFVYPELIAKLLLAAAFAGFLVASLREKDPVIGTGRLFGGLLLCSATVYPWYLLSVLPFAALCRHRAWLSLSALIQLSYLSQITGVAHLPWMFVAIWGPFFWLLARSRWSTD